MKLKVKIALAANAEGEWHAYGFRQGKDWIDMMDAFELLDGEQRFWVTAEIEVAETEPEVAGVATQAVEADH